MKVLINLLYNRGELEVQQLRDKTRRLHEPIVPINIHIKPATIILTLLLPNIQTRNMTYQHLVTYSDEIVMKHLYPNADDEVLMLNQQ